MDVSPSAMVESMRGGEFLCKNANEVWDFLDDLNDKAYEWETITEVPNIASQIFMDNKRRLPNDFVVLENTMLHSEHQFEVLCFNHLNLMITSALFFS